MDLTPSRKGWTPTLDLGPRLGAALVPAGPGFKVLFEPMPSLRRPKAAHAGMQPRLTQSQSPISAKQASNRPAPRAHRRCPGRP
jgi:hypothetical protein